jgi:hypothetical protein
LNAHCGVLPPLVALAQVSPAAASEMCIQVDYSTSLPYADLAFAGTLLKNEADVRLTFQADRIWKGSPPGRQIVVYELGMPSVDSIGLPQGQRYVILAKVLSPEDRDRNGISADETAFGMGRPCGRAPIATPTVIAQLDKVAKPRKPPDR